MNEKTMNGKKVFRTALPVILTLVLIALITLTVTIVSKPDFNANITNPNGAYVKLDGYAITNEKLYLNMRYNYGITEMLAYVDQILLKDEKVEFVVQEEQLGPGHACKMAYDKLKDFDGDTLILAGDMPLVGTNNINLIMNYHNENNYAMTILSALFENPFSYGRIIRHI